MYIKGTYISCLGFLSGDYALQDCTCAYYACGADSKQSTSKYLVTYVGDNFMAIKVLNMHFIVVSFVDACKKVLWMKNFLRELGMKQDQTICFEIVIVISILQTIKFLQSTKHIDVR
jgi:hypothetical protein